MANITIAEVRALALRHYDEGGDGVYECYEDDIIQEAIDEGMNTEAHWLKDFKTFDSILGEVLGF